MSQSNATQRALQIVKSCEAHAKGSGHVGVFVTLTLPSHLHPTCCSDDGSVVVNSEYQSGLTPRDGQQQLLKSWIKLCANLRSTGYGPYGLRLVDPCRDATPHWHALLWMESTVKMEALEALLRYYFKRENVRITRLAKSDVASDFNKYLAKPSEREEQWASIWGIKRITAIGLNAFYAPGKGGAA